jgi:hypothetical protein
MTDSCVYERHSYVVFIITCVFIARYDIPTFNFVIMFCNRNNKLTTNLEIK